MKTIVEFLMQKGKIFAKLGRVENKHLGTKRRISVYFGVDTQKYYHIVVYTAQKSRLLQKDVLAFEQIHTRMQTLKECTIKKKILMQKGGICSKARQNLQKAGWIVYDFS